MSILDLFRRRKNLYSENVEKRDSFIQDGSVWSRLDGKELSDRDIEYLKQVTIEKQNEQIQDTSISFERMLPEATSQYEVSDEEKRFLKCFYDELLESKVKPFINSNRLSDGTINVKYRGMPVGRIRLQGRKHTMQILIGTNGNNKVIEGTVEDFLPYLHKWVRYIINYLK